MEDELLFRALTGRCTDAERTLVQQWRNASQANESRYRELSELLEAALQADTSRARRPMPSVQAIVARADVSRRAPRTDALMPTHVASSSARVWLKTVAAAAAVLALAVGAYGVRSYLKGDAGFRMSEVVTGPAESVTISLADGSVVRLGPESRFRISPVELSQPFLEGQAYFAVAKQDAAPLRIKTSVGAVRVHGTRFRLDARGPDLELLVVEGLVVLEANGAETEVSAMELVRITEGFSPPQVQRLPVIDLQVAAFMPDWLDNFLAFQETPLANVARELERQFGVPVEISDAGLASRTFTGWFFGWTLDEVVEVVCVATNADCSSTAEGSVIMQAKRTSR